MMFCSTVMPRHEGQLLVDEAHAELAGRAAASPIGDGLAVDRDLAAVGLDQAGQHPDQGRFAGAVGADQAMHLAGQRSTATRPCSAWAPP